MVNGKQIHWYITRCLSEVFCSATLLFFGCMGCIETLIYPRLGVLEIGINFGVIVTLCLMTYGSISGAQLTPTVTLSAFMVGRIEWYWALIYFICQTLGAILGYGALYLIFPANIHTDLCLSALNPDINLVQALVIEFACTAVLSLFCYGVWDKAGLDQHDSVSIRFGCCVMAMVFSGVHFSGASMNLPRTLAPAIINANFKDLWVYVVADLPAPILMGLLWKYVLRPDVPEESSAE